MSHIEGSRIGPRQDMGVSRPARGPVDLIRIRYPYNIRIRWAREYRRTFALVITTKWLRELFVLRAAMLLYSITNKCIKKRWTQRFRSSRMPRSIAKTCRKGWRHETWHHRCAGQSATHHLYQRERPLRVQEMLNVECWKLFCAKIHNLSLPLRMQKKGEHRKHKIRWTNIFPEH